MFKRTPVWLKSAAYAFRGGFLIRPFLIVIALGTVGAVLSSLEEQFPEIRSFVPEALFPSQADPQVAQAILTSIATSTMTVVSIVFAILLMTLTLASTQFSPRILVSFVRDHVTQWTLGIFLGTFSYCIAALPAARSLPTPFVPVVTIVGAMALAPVCVGWLIYFIHHISNAISVNHIVDRIARETEEVIDQLMPDPWRPAHHDLAFGAPLESIVHAIKSPRSGYIRFVDIPRLTALAKAYGVCLRLGRRVGQFVPEGGVLLTASRSERISAERAAEFLAAIDIGPTRTMQQDVEFGVVQIVDIALRAISPAVNDPTTAISSVDQFERHPDPLGRSLAAADLPLRSAPRAARHRPWADFEGVLDLAFEQVRHYAARHRRQPAADAGARRHIEREPQSGRSPSAPRARQADPTAARAASSPSTSTGYANATLVSRPTPRERAPRRFPDGRRSVHLVRQRRHRKDADALLDQRPGLGGTRPAADRPLRLVASVHGAGDLGKFDADVVGVRLDLLPQAGDHMAGLAALVVEQRLRGRLDCGPFGLRPPPAP